MVKLFLKVGLTLLFFGIFFFAFGQVKGNTVEARCTTGASWLGCVGFEVRDGSSVGPFLRGATVSVKVGPLKGPRYYCGAPGRKNQIFQKTTNSSGYVDIDRVCCASAVTEIRVLVTKPGYLAWPPGATLDTNTWANFNSVVVNGSHSNFEIYLYPEPDYVVRNGSGGTNPSLSGPTTRQVGQSGTWSFRTYNLGGNTGTTSTTRVTAGPDASNPSDNNSVPGRAKNAHTSDSFTTSFRTAGWKTITVKADHPKPGSIRESNENNNNAQILVNVTAAPPPPDGSFTVRAKVGRSLRSGVRIPWWTAWGRSISSAPNYPNTQYTYKSSTGFETRVEAPATLSDGSTFASWTGCFSVGDPTNRVCQSHFINPGQSRVVTANYNPPVVVQRLTVRARKDRSYVSGVRIPRWTSWGRDISSAPGYPTTTYTYSSPTGFETRVVAPLTYGGANLTSWTGCVDGSSIVSGVCAPGWISSGTRTVVANYTTPPVGGKPDYVIRNSTGGTSPDISGPTSVCVNTSALYRARTYNVGTAAATSGSTTRATASGGASNASDNYSVPALSIGSNRSHNFRTSWATTGSKTITFRADNNGNIAELNEGNNVESITVTVNSCPVVEDSDIVAHSLAIFHQSGPFGGQRVTNNEPADKNEPLVAELDYDEHNGVQATNFEAWFWEDRVGDPFNSGCSPLGRTARKTGLSTLLPAFTRSKEYISFDAPGSVGDKNAWQFIDASCTVKEERENNNTDSVVYRVGTPLSIDIQINPGNFSVEQGDPAVSYTVTVDPQGSGFTGNVSLSMDSVAALNASNVNFSPFAQPTVTISPGGGSELTTFTVATTVSPFTALGSHDLRVIGVGTGVSATGTSTITVSVPSAKPWTETRKGSVGARDDIATQSNTPPPGEYNADYTFLYKISRSNFESAKSWSVQYSVGFSPKSLEASFNIYNDLLQRYKGRGTKTVNLGDRNNIMNNIQSKASSGSGILTYGNSAEFKDANTYLGKPAIIFIDGGLTIDKEVIVDTNTALVFVVRGDIDVDDDVQRMDGFYITDGRFNSKANPSSDKQLTVNGSVISFSEPNLGRDLSKNSDPSDDLDPSEIIDYTPRYLWMLRDVLGETGNAFEEITP